MIVFPPPPVCTAHWNDSDWAMYIRLHGVENEPETIKNSFGLWRKTGQTDINGEALYSLAKPA
jgi:hypothetical protein